MLGDDVAAALPELQAHALSMMRDRCAIKRPTGNTTSDDYGNVVTEYESTPIYSGPCRVRQRSSSVSEEIGGAETLSTTTTEAHLPVSAGHVFLPNDGVFMGAETTPRYRVLEDHDVTFQTAIRLPVERVR